MNLVENRFDKIRIGNDDQLAFYIDAVNTLTKDQKEIFYKECDIVDELEKKHGVCNVTEEMKEQAFINAGLESA